jgi:hypothetical protein
MTFDELNVLIKETMWFSRLGEPDVDKAYIRISTLAPGKIADQMEWLPSSRDQDDPIHGRSLEQRAEALGKKQEFAKQSLEMYKTTLTALRKFEGHPALKVGPHDFTEAARGAALFAVRRAAYEILLGEPRFWCRLMKIYHAGHWPCGLLPDKQIVVL